MRVLFVSNLYPPNVVGGYERLCFGVAAAFADRGHEVSVLTSAHGGHKADYPGQRVGRTLRLLAGETIYAPFAGDAAARDALNRMNIAALSETVAEDRPDAVFTWNLFFLDSSFLEALSSCGVPVTAMLTDNWLANMLRPEFNTAFFRDHVFGDLPFPTRSASPPVLPPARPGIFGRLFGRAPTSVVAPPLVEPAPTPQSPLHLPIAAVFGSDFVRAYYEAAGIRFAQHRVVHNGVPQQERPASDFQNRTRLVRDGELRLLFAGRLVDIKGAETAVEALSLLRPEQVESVKLRLTILGDGQDTGYMQRLQQAINRSGCIQLVALRPPVPESALFALFQEHDIYLFPSLYEPFSLTLIHALACGIPTVASDTGGNPEIVKDGDSGILIEKGSAEGLAQAIRQLAINPALRARVAQGGRTSAAQFTFDAMVDGMEAFLRDGIG
jgi:glycogen(starch) synthase